MRPEHEEWICKNVPDGEALMKSEDPNDLLIALDDMMLMSLDENYKPTMKTGEISKVYDAVYSDMN